MLTNFLACHAQIFEKMPALEKLETEVGEAEVEDEKNDVSLEIAVENVETICEGPKIQAEIILPHIPVKPIEVVKPIEIVKPLQMVEPITILLAGLETKSEPEYNYEIPVLVKAEPASLGYKMRYRH